MQIRSNLDGKSCSYDFFSTGSKSVDSGSRQVNVDGSISTAHTDEEIRASMDAVEQIAEKWSR